MDYDDMNEAQHEAFWNEVTWENAEIAAAKVGGMRRDAAMKLIEGIQDGFKRLGFGSVGCPTIAIYAEELARLAQLPEPAHNVQLLEMPSEEAVA
ncbi:hypothetical protein [Neotabrizicola sp. sgz301269]|uniref:hypothetical protein n=1 Tax=Neotabrizicola sp. sgz301269 TaxID=3276282 RepID=UPI0037704EC2